MELSILLNNSSENESSLCLAFLMQSCSAVFTNGAAEINRKIVEEGDQDQSLPENVTKLVKKFLAEQEYPFDGIVFQLSLFFPNIFFCHHSLNLQSVVCWFYCHFWLHLTQIKYLFYFLLLQMLFQDIHHTLKPHWNPTLWDTDVLNCCLNRESEMNQSQVQGLNSQSFQWVKQIFLCKVQTTRHLAA